jgi:hypothetical protein
MPKVVRISQRTALQLDELVELMGISKQAIVEKAVSRLLRDEFLKKTNEEYAQIKANPYLWSIELQERKEWDATLSDGLE